MGKKTLAQDWTREDIRYLLEQLEQGPILVSDTHLGLPTIHGQSGEMIHLGYGLFEVRTPDYTIRFCGGGAMQHTPGGKAWTWVTLARGVYPYDTDAVRRVLQDGLAEDGCGVAWQAGDMALQPPDMSRGGASDR